MIVEFNQDNTLFSIYNQGDIKIIKTAYPLKIQETFSDIPVIRKLCMFYRTNIILFVGDETVDPLGENKYACNILYVYDACKKSVAAHVKFDGDINDIQLLKSGSNENSDLANSTMSVHSGKYIYIYKMNNMNAYTDKIYTTNTNYCMSDKYLIYIDSEQNEEFINVYDLRDRKIITRFKAHNNRIKFMTLNSDKKMLATASERGTIIRIFDVEDGVMLHEFRRGTSSSNIEYITFSSKSDNNKSEYVAVISDRNTVHIYNLTTPTSNRKSILSLFGGYFNSEWSFAWFYDEKINKTKKCYFDVNNDLVIITESSTMHKLVIDKKNGGMCDFVDTI